MAHPDHELSAIQLDPFRIETAAAFRLTDFQTSHAAPTTIDKTSAKSLLQAGIERLNEHQERLYADATWSVLIVFQAMDAGGKDSMIKHVMSGLNPQGISVTSFKAPGREELAHDFLWRVSKALPVRGMIGVFNRSHYEEVVVTRVKPALLEQQGLPIPLRDGSTFWNQRLEDIANFERYLARQGTVVLKFFLHISKEEQKSRLLKRLDDPAKHWKFDVGDLDDRARWDEYMDAYGQAIMATATPDAPWFVVPADQKWFARLVVVQAINDALARLQFRVPDPSPEASKEFTAAREKLLNQD